VRRLVKLIYRLKLRRPFRSIDRLHYLRRLQRESNVRLDEWYRSDKDADQFAAGEVLICSEFRSTAVMFYCDPRFHVERQIIRHGLFGPHLLIFMAEFIAPDTRVLDIGANVGAYTIPLAKAFPSVVVDAFEPNPYATARLRRNLALNKTGNVRLYEVGAGGRAAVMQLHAFAGPDLGSSSFFRPRAKGPQPRLITVKVVAIDDVYRDDVRPVSLIKIDVQGFELQVLHGARQLITRYKPVILLEHEDGNFESVGQALATKRELAQFFTEQDYRVFYVTRHDPHMLFPVAWERPLFGDLLALPAWPVSE
jgi:FkbM family methyltransferase